MKCYICDTELIPTKVIINDKETPALKCPLCNDSLTTVIYAEDYRKAIK